MVRVAIAIVMLVSATARADSECASPNTRRPACTKGDASACTWLGEFYTGHVAAQDTTMYSSVGIKLLDGACSKGIGEACHELFGALTTVAALASRTPDMKRFRDLRAKACRRDLLAGELRDRVAAPHDARCDHARVDAA